MTKKAVQETANNILKRIAALIVCMSFFCVTASAEASAPPEIKAWFNGDMLRVQTSDGVNGVEAVYVNQHRFNYLVDGVLDIYMPDYADNSQYVTIWAVDFAGNKSNVVKKNNPYYIPTAEPTIEPTPEPTPESTPEPEPTLQPTPEPTEKPKPELTSTPIPIQTPESTPPVQMSTPVVIPELPTPEPQTTATPEATAIADTTSEPASPTQANPFTPEGAGAVIDNATDGDGKEFFTVTTEDDSVFYLVIDRQRNGNNVYLLNEVTIDDLTSLARKKGMELDESLLAPTPTAAPVQYDPPPTIEPVLEPTPAPTDVPGTIQGDESLWTYILIFAAAALFGGLAYYQRVVKPKQERLFDEDDGYDDDGEDEDAGYEDSEYESTEDED